MFCAIATDRKEANYDTRQLKIHLKLLVCQNTPTHVPWRMCLGICVTKECALVYLCFATGLVLLRFHDNWTGIMFP